MPNLRPTELIIILLIIVLLFGAKKLPELAKSIGQSMKIFRAETKTDDPATQQTVNTATPLPQLRRQHRLPLPPYPKPSR